MFHCFLQEEYVAEKLLDWNQSSLKLPPSPSSVAKAMDDRRLRRTSRRSRYYIGIDGPISYPKNQWLRDIVKNFPLTNIILETDAPFLPLQFMRGKKNEPQHIRGIAETIADIKSIPLKEVGEQTTKNVHDLFGI